MDLYRPNGSYRYIAPLWLDTVAGPGADADQPWRWTKPPSASATTPTLSWRGRADAASVGGRSSSACWHTHVQQRGLRPTAALRASALGHCWSGNPFVAAQRAFATSLLKPPLHLECHDSSPEPDLHKALADSRWTAPATRQFAARAA